MKALIDITKLKEEASEYRKCIGTDYDGDSYHCDDCEFAFICRNIKEC